MKKSLHRFLPLPSIDIWNSKVVRLKKGDINKGVVFFENVEEAGKWLFEKRIKFIHTVDLNGAIEGERKNINLVKKLKEKFGFFIQYGGGIRDINSFCECLDMGFDLITVGTSIFMQNYKDFLKYREKLAIALDIKNQKVMIKGWKEASVNLDEAIEIINQIKPQRAILTDIERDGTLQGIDQRLILKVKEKLDTQNIEFFYAGGISSRKDIENLEKLKLDGCIIGKAIYLNNELLEFCAQIQAKYI